MLLNMTPLQINFFLESAAQMSSIYEINENQQQPPDLTCYLYFFSSSGSAASNRSWIIIFLQTRLCKYLKVLLISCVRQSKG